VLWLVRERLGPEAGLRPGPAGGPAPGWMGVPGNGGLAGGGDSGRHGSFVATIPRATNVWSLMRRGGAFVATIWGVAVRVT
jgi:hypothetical protein